jgi:hypothetical protein
MVLLPNSHVILEETSKNEQSFAKRLSPGLNLFPLPRLAHNAHEILRRLARRDKITLSEVIERYLLSAANEMPLRDPRISGRSKMCSLRTAGKPQETKKEGKLSPPSREGYKKRSTGLCGGLKGIATS